MYVDVKEDDEEEETDDEGEGDESKEACIIILWRSSC